MGDILGKSPSPPPAPDYVGAAQAQGAANKEAAMATAALNNPNQVNYDGSTKSWSLRPGADPNNPQIGDWTVTTNLGQTGQQLQNMNNTNALALGAMSNSALAGLQNSFANPYTGQNLPSQVTSNLPTDANAFAANGKAVQDAMYGKLTSDFGNQFGRQEDSMRTRLSNQGLDENSEAYRNQVHDFDTQRNTAYSNAMDQAVMAGGAEQTRAMNAQIAAMQAQQAARGTAMSQDLALRNQPMNELNALRTGSQVAVPTFQGYSQNNNVAAAPVFAGAQAQGQAAQNIYNQQMAGSNALTGGLASLAGSALPFFL